MLKKLAAVWVVLLVGCGPSKQQLNIFTWPDDLDPRLVAEFEQRFHCHVSIDLYDSAESMMAKLAAGGDSVYDLVVPGNYNLPTLVHRGLLAPLRPENIPNLANLDPQFVNPTFDPQNRYGAPYQWGTAGLLARTAAGHSLEETWGLLFDGPKQPGRVLLLDDMNIAIGAALQYRGHPIGSTNLSALSQALELLVDAKKRSQGFGSSTVGRNRVLSKDVVLAHVYSSEGLWAEKEDSETHYFIPKEGGAKWVAVFSIPSKAPHRDLAEAFINFILEPKVSARLVTFNRNATANRAALEYLDPADRANPGLYPPPEVMRRLEYTQDLGPMTKLYDELWALAKSR